MTDNPQLCTGQQQQQQQQQQPQIQTQTDNETQQQQHPETYTHFQGCEPKDESLPTGNQSNTDVDFELPASATILQSPVTSATRSVHVHQSSSDEVSDIIRKWQPETVFIELCRSRAGLVLNSIDASKVNYLNSTSRQRNNQSFIHQQQQQQEQQGLSEQQDALATPKSSSVGINDDDQTQTQTQSNNSEQQTTSMNDDVEGHQASHNNDMYRTTTTTTTDDDDDQYEYHSPSETHTDTETETDRDTYTDADDEGSYASETPHTTTPPTPADNGQNGKGASFKDMINTIKQQGLPGLLHVLMAEMIRKAGDQSKVGPGAEFITAFVEAKKIGAKIVLGDRLVEITLQRVWNSLTRWEKIKFVYCLFMASLTEVTQQDIDQLKNSDEQLVLELLNEFQEKFPSVVQTIVTERDQYMAARLRLCPGRKIVAVVGKGHVSGIVREWHNFNINLTELESTNVQPMSRKGSSGNDYTGWLTKWATFLIIPIASVTLYLLHKRYWHYV
ncbi:hypothetical protein SAMD00019534_020820 [Acytostelium subglobosum LB1]|uniref:hypothetical protein n=1 Tax=Acytostelium subglobosum LB1 TaxID=1410327 RepID=UPI000644AC88|nr:hypothetical protein SAMD00019534_020820 [Acytostelium subglobosum LB1]GAM18907.1 hypothetical protein SAMD00019534_020820 [Acytostelium subglobosum LB1]|eukprot:XP_012758127.1 hypothetical protein SAMD00019534_020820 [Acytostelium subglobosum LB1]